MRNLAGFNQTNFDIKFDQRKIKQKEFDLLSIATTAKTSPDNTLKCNRNR